MHPRYHDDEYTQEDWMWYQHGYGLPPPIHYSAVEIDDVESKGDPLIGNEAVVLYEDYVRPPQRRTISHSSLYDNPRTAVGLPKAEEFGAHEATLVKDSLLNPQNGSIVYANDPVTIRMYSHHQCCDPEAWVFFACYNLDVWQGPRKQRTKDGSPEYQYSWQAFRANIKVGASWGFVQFFQSAKNGAKSNQGLIPYGTVRTVFLCRTAERYASSRFYPPVMAIKPEAAQTYVPLQANQVLQLITSDMCNVQMPTVADYPAVRLTTKHAPAIGERVCHYFKCHYTPVHCYPIFFSAKDTQRQGAVIVPSLEHDSGRFADKAVYAVVHSPMEGLEFYANNVDGIIFRTSDPLFENFSIYLDSQCKLKIESKSRFHHTDGPEAFDIKMRIMDKNLKKLKFTNLFDPHACKVT